jgi:hypothetical protein
MKTAMKLTTGILAIAMTAGAAFSTKAAAQDTDAIDNARSIAKSLQQKQANDSNAALDAAGVPNPAKPAAGAPAPAVKPAVIPVSQPSAPVTAPAAKPAVKPVAKAASTSATNQLQRVNVVPGGDKIQIELSSSAAVTPKVSKLGSPARILIEMPDTVMAGAQNKIAVGTAGIKGVRIGMDGKTPPTTSVVVDLDKALAYEVTPAANGKFVLTLHTDGAAPAPQVAKTTPAPAKTPVAKAVVAKAVAVKAEAPKTVPAKAPGTTAPAARPAVAKAVAAKPAVAKTAVVAANQPPAKLAPKTEPFAPKTEVKKADEAKPEDKKAEDKKDEDKKWAMNGKRDPFFSPVVQQGGSGCSTGKKCLDIGNINLRGVVKSDTGFIAVVTNNMNKAYFLRENDPVFNGYVMKITGDSVTFQETVQDKLGKSFTREVVKRIFTPAV